MIDAPSPTPVTSERSQTRRIPASGSAGLAASGWIQAALGVEFFLSGLNKCADPNYVRNFRLFCLSLIPVLTEWVRDEYRHALPAASYGAVALAAGLAYTILVRALIQANGRESRLARAIGSDIKGYLSLVLYAAAVALAFVSPWISYAIFVAVAVMWFVPDRRFTRRQDG
jgi:uncharacterized membrane protein